MKIDPNIKEDLKKYLKEREKKQAKKILITSAYPLSRDEKNSLFRKIPSIEKAELEEIVDPTIVAGFIIRQDSKVLDYSLLGMIKQLKTSLS